MTKEEMVAEINAKVAAIMAEKAAKKAKTAKITTAEEGIAAGLSVEDIARKLTNSHAPASCEWILTKDSEPDKELVINKVAAEHGLLDLNKKTGKYERSISGARLAAHIKAGKLTGYTCVKVAK